MSADKNSSAGLIFVVSGPSGSGKTTLANAVLAQKTLGRRLERSISFTTRPKRSGERHAKDYFFITRNDFIRLRKQKKILEWTKYLGYYYGTAKDFVEQKISAGVSLVLCLDIKGAKAIKKLYPRNAVTIFVIPPSEDALKIRIEKRCRHTTASEIRRRLAVARKEMRFAHEYDYCVVNDDLHLAVKNLKGIIKESFLQ